MRDEPSTARLCVVITAGFLAAIAAMLYMNSHGVLSGGNTGAAIYPIAGFGAGVTWAAALALGIAPPVRPAPRFSLLLAVLIGDAGVWVLIMLLAHVS